MKITYIGSCDDDKNLEFEKEIVIVGCGRRGKGIIDYMSAKGLISIIVAIADNDQTKQGSEYRGIQVISLAEAKKIYPNAAYVITTVCVSDLVCQLERLQIKNVHILRAVAG